jgi:hypothetical protein
MYCVFNLKEEKLAFPYRMDDSRVCYISGHNPSVIKSVIKCLAKAVNEHTQINPTMILEEALKTFDTSSLHVSLSVTDDTKTNSTFYTELYNSLLKNVPPKSDKRKHLDVNTRGYLLTTMVDSDSGCDSDSYDSDSD